MHDAAPAVISNRSANKFLHVVYRVGDLEKTVEFYTKVLGMTVLRRRDDPVGRYTNVFLGYGTQKNNKHFAIELTYNYGVREYRQAKLGFLGLGLVRENLTELTGVAVAHGGSVLKDVADAEITPSQFPDEPAEQYRIWKMATIEDPNGYPIELVEKSQADSMHRVRLHVSTMEKSIEFYTQVMGMTLLRKRSMLPKWPAISSWLGYGIVGDDFAVPILELVYEYSTEKLDVGEGYGHLAISTPDLKTSLDNIRDKGGKIVKEVTVLPGIGTKIAACLDPDGYKIVLVDAQDFDKELACEKIKTEIA